MTLKKIFWSHPKLRDYRMPFFDLLNQRYQITFFFNYQGEINSNLNAFVSRTGSRRLNIIEIIYFYKQIKKADVFISSHLLKNPTLIGILFSVLLRKRIIIWEELSYLHDDFKKKVKYVIIKYIAKFVDCFYVAGLIQRSILMNLGIPSKKIYVTNEYPGYVYSRIKPKKVDGIKVDQDKIILYLGKLKQLKGVEYIIEAFRLLSTERDDIKLIIVGTGDCEQRLKAKAEGMQKVIFHPPIIDVHEKAYLFNICNMVIVSSIISKQGVEGGPLVVLEALSSGTPVIATNATGSSAQFIIEDINGYIVNHSDALALYEKMKTILSWNDRNKIKNRILYYFNKIPNHDNQADVMSEAIESALS